MLENHWHVDTVDEIVGVADNYLQHNAEGQAATAYDTMKSLDKAGDFLTRAAIVHLTRKDALIIDPSPSDVSQDLKQWTKSADAYRVRWFSPLVREAAADLVDSAAHAVGVGANRVLRHAQENLERPFTTEEGSPTYLRPVELLEEARKRNS